MGFIVSLKSAQRLTASHIESQADHEALLAALETCSTPYGISYRITYTRFDVQVGLFRVLNALRHLI